MLPKSQRCLNRPCRAALDTKPARFWRAHAVLDRIPSSLRAPTPADSRQRLRTRTHSQLGRTCALRLILATVAL